MAKRRYRPGGKSHRILARLRQGDAGFLWLLEAALPGAENTKAARRSVRFVLEHLTQEGLVMKGHRSYSLTVAGHRLAEDLGPPADEAPPSYAVPSVRIFARPAA